MKKIIEKPFFPYLFFLLCWLLTILLYYPAHEAMLIDDGVNAIDDIQKQGFNGLINSYKFDSFYHGYYFILNILYAVFKLNSIGWFCFFSLLHASNTTLLFITIRNVLNRNKGEKRAVEIAIVSSLFFLLSPYNAENIVWAATTHYVVGLFILLFSLQWLHSFFQNSSTNKGLVVFWVLNVFALFTFELNFASPFIYLLFYVLYRVSKSTEIPLRKFMSRIILPIGAAIIIYVVLLYINKGTIMLHDGKGATILPPANDIIAQYGRHFIRLFTFVQYASIQLRDKVYGFCQHWQIVILVLTILGTLFIYLIYKKSKTAAINVVFFLFVGTLFLLPFTRGYFVYIFKYENLRYSYFASAFLFTAFIIFLFYINRYIRYSVVTIYLILFIIFILQTVNDKQQSAVVYHRFIETFPNQKSSKIFLLNTPSFCNESYMFWDRSRLPIALSCYRHLDVKKQIEQVLFYNSISDHDTFEVKKINDSCWSFQLKANGSWLMNDYMGASDYETDRFVCDVGEWGGYKIQFRKRLRADEDIIYFNGKNFQSVK